LRGSASTVTTQKSTSASPLPAAASTPISGGGSDAQLDALLAAQLKALCPHNNVVPNGIWCEDNDGHTAVVRIFDTHALLLNDIRTNPPPARVTRRLVYGPTWLVITNAASFAQRVAAATHGAIGIPR
jgi:hypothetical protein